MTNQDAINCLKNIKNNLSADWSKEGNSVQNALRIAIESLEKAEKYKWHDLRKNPDDLPEKDGLASVNVLCDLGGVSYVGAYLYEDCEMIYGYKSPGAKYVVKGGQWTIDRIPWKVYAWRYMDKFEEAEE